MALSSVSDYSILFGNSSSSSQGTGGLFGTSGSSSLLADYASIKNGSYRKLAKAYYKKQQTQESGTTPEENKKTASSEERLAANATKLKASVSALRDNKSLFEKVKKKDKDGNITEDYDWEAISEKVQSFVDNYNETFAGSSKSDTKASFRAGTNMAAASAVHSGLLNKAGITIAEDGKLSLDKDKLKESDIGTLKTLFSGTGSYADNIASRATSIVSSSTNMANSLYNSAGSRTYTSSSAGLDTIV